MRPFSERRLTGSFADSQLTDALRALATDPSTDQKVKKKLVSVLGAWHTQFKDDPSMNSVANLYNVVKPHHAASASRGSHSVEDMYQIDAAGLGSSQEESYEERRRREERERKEKKEEEKRKAKEAKEAKEAEKLRLKLLEEEKRKSRGKNKRQAAFNFEQVCRDFWNCPLPELMVLFAGKASDFNGYRRSLHRWK